MQVHWLAPLSVSLTIGKIMEDKVITILVPWTHDEETGLDIYDTDFAHDTFINEIAECESHNQNIFDAWNEKQKDYADDQR